MGKSFLRCDQNIDRHGMTSISSLLYHSAIPFQLHYCFMHYTIVSIITEAMPRKHRRPHRRGDHMSPAVGRQCPHTSSVSFQLTPSPQGEGFSVGHMGPTLRIFKSWRSHTTLIHYYLLPITLHKKKTTGINQSFLSVLGSDATAACGGSRELSEWPRSKKWRIA